ncbi:MAG TPA: hypothetical protein VF017_06835 [Thermoanaerobaculia bacterium]|nr:hypothetical protein [Thermoanaerobaculia bacterium]
MACSGYPLAGQEPIEPLEGLDPVLLTEGKEVDGDPALTVTRGGFRYSFASAETCARFEAEPTRYEIQLEGFCARMGGLTRGNPDLFAVHAGRIYLFGSAGCRTRFQAAPERYLEPPRAPLAERAGATQLAAGRRLIDKAVAALGGEGRLARLTTVRIETAGTAPTVWTVRLPHSLRRETSLSIGPLIAVATPERGFAHIPGRAFETFSAAQRRALELEALRDPFLLLLSRHDPSFVAARVEDATGTEEVEVESLGQAATLALEPDTGRLLSLRYLGRNDEGEMGLVVENFSDFRTVDGLSLPFTRQATWNGAPLPQRSATVRAIELDAELAAGVFNPPATGSGS